MTPNDAARVAVRAAVEANASQPILFAAELLIELLGRERIGAIDLEIASLRSAAVGNLRPTTS